ncbi:hypothetical protein LTR36_000418 [Oleoguttula mirabilis]|uniref:Uncharacterized protein n=1 Tax=Oleoguttula mirabilis TaxID=1507867 RepID=A0AAV9JZ26_9PEZI|nr:hypothetical protein LTR36_000418 [Oleoguttula mirabilis]
MTVSATAVVTLPQNLLAATGSSALVQATSTLLISIAASTAAASASYSTSATAAASAYALPDDLPRTHNRWLAIAGDVALYNTDLLATAIALFQHTAVFGTLFLLRGFSPKRALDLHYLTIVFALSFVALPLVFLFDLRIDEVKLLFFLEHEAVEYLIAIRVLAPAKFVARNSGLIVLLSWCGLVLLTIPVVLDHHFHHSADVVAWCAFTSDFLLGISGLTLVRRWAVSHPLTRFTLRKSRAEAMAGVAFMLHGFVTMSVGPVFALVLYDDVDPAYFAYVFVAVFLSAFFAVAFMIPVAGIFFANVWWCCGQRKAILPGQAEWYEGLEDNKGGPRAEQDYYAGDVAPRYAAYAAAREEEIRSPNEAWNVQLPEERSTAWQSVGSPSRLPPKSNVYYRDVLKDLLAR